jgi:hypothetical protein
LPLSALATPLAHPMKTAAKNNLLLRCIFISLTTVPLAPNEHDLARHSSRNVHFCAALPVGV